MPRQSQPNDYPRFLNDLKERIRAAKVLQIESRRGSGCTHGMVLLSGDAL